MLLQKLTFLLHNSVRVSLTLNMSLFLLKLHQMFALLPCCLSNESPNL